MEWGESVEAGSELQLCKGKNKVKLVFWLLCYTAYTFKDSRRRNKVSLSYSHTLYNCLYFTQEPETQIILFIASVYGAPSTGPGYDVCSTDIWKDGCVNEWMRSHNSSNLFSSHKWLFQDLTQTFTVYRGERYFSIPHYQNFVFGFQLFRPDSPGIEEADQDWSQTWDYLLLFPRPWPWADTQFLFSEESCIMTICGAQPGWPSTVMQNLRSDHGYRKLSVKSLGTRLHVRVCVLALTFQRQDSLFSRPANSEPQHHQAGEAKS